MGSSMGAKAINRSHNGNNAEKNGSSSWNALLLSSPLRSTRSLSPPRRILDFDLERRHPEFEGCGNLPSICFGCFLVPLHFIVSR